MRFDLEVLSEDFFVAATFEGSWNQHAIIKPLSNALFPPWFNVYS